MLTIARKIERITAHKNPSTEKPGTMVSVNKIITAFITTVKSPKVINVIGKVRIKSIGLITALIIPKTSAVIIAAVKFSTWTAGKR